MGVRFFCFQVKYDLCFLVKLVLYVIFITENHCKANLGLSVGRTNVRLCSGATNTTPSTTTTTNTGPPASPSTGYIYVNDAEKDMSWGAISERAAQTIFWTELVRGAAVVIAHIFKVIYFILYVILSCNQ